MQPAAKHSKNTKSALHHWWPKCLFKYWANDKGIVHQIFTDGKIIRQTNPKNFGAIKDAHTIKFSSTPNVWDQSFEGIFSDADSAFPSIIDWLKTIEGKKVKAKYGFQVRLFPEKVEDEQLDLLLECILSLVVRSPQLRNHTKSTTEYFRKKGGLKNYSADKKLVNLNHLHTFDTFFNDVKGRGKFTVILSDKKEFIFGDGFYNNYTSSTHPPLTPRILIPLTPNITIFYTRPQTYSTDPRLTVLQLEKNEVCFFNDTIQIYSCDSVFYRKQKPEIIADFKCREHMEYEHNTHAALEHLSLAVATLPF